ncbi:PLDc N-terminal domain-containing protein [Candidatus Woesearchaeota archaeon]|nr:PLDc N-terminal domain-containing protein [Candidatus Woesearchaeota archaeon]
MGYGFWSIIAIICAVWVIYDVHTKQKKFSDTKKLVWTILAVLPGLNILVAILYYFIEKAK